MNKIWFHQKFHDTEYLWEVGTSIKKGDIYWFNGPFPCCLMPDTNNFRLNLKKALILGEIVVCNKSYKDDS